jgi:hypothetical protein
VEKRLLEQVFDLATVAASDAQDAQGHGANELAAEVAEGLAAFIEKRPARFGGTVELNSAFTQR